MKRILTFFVSFIVFTLSAFSDNGKVYLDSLSVDANNNQSVATFHINVTSPNFYKLFFWIMGVKHTNLTYSSYQIKINGVLQSSYLQTSEGDWQFVSPTRPNSFYLGTGVHQIQVIGTLEDIPNIEHLAYSSTTPSGVVDPKLFYEKEKTHTNKSIMVVEPFNYHKEFFYSSSLNNQYYPQCLFTAHVSKRAFYTFYRKEYYSSGQTITFQTDTQDSISHVLHVFSESNPASNTWSAFSPGIDGGHANLTVNITQSGFYYILLRSFNESEWGKCNLTINNDRRFENIPINNYRTNIQLTYPSRVHACFAKGNGVDPIIFLVDNDSVGNVINYNDDYPYDSTISSYDWGNNARINQVLSDSYWVLTTKKYTEFDKSVDPRVDTFTGCEMANSQYSAFPNYKVDDIMFSGYSAYTYNCISWALGEWLIGYWLNDFGGHQIEAIDSLFSIYGFSRQGVSESNSVIDLWGKTNPNGTYNCLHASVRAKRQLFATGYDWESKLGPQQRVFHPRYSLESNEYGNVIAHYARVQGTRSETDSLPIRTILNIEMSPEDILMINDRMATINECDISAFDRLYQLCKEESSMKVGIFINQFEEIDSYRELLDWCKTNTEMLPVIFDRVIENDILAVKLLFDLTTVKYGSIWDDVHKELAMIRNGNTEFPIVYSLQTEAKLFIKALLEKQDAEYAARNGMTLSSDNILTLNVGAESIDVSFSLNSESNVSLVFADVFGTNIQYVLNNIPMQEGDHHITIQKPSTGTYIIGLISNGSVYEKKIRL